MSGLFPPLGCLRILSAAFVKLLVATSRVFSDILGARQQALGALRARRRKSGARFAQVWRKFACRHGTAIYTVLEKYGVRRVGTSLVQVLEQVVHVGKTRTQEFTFTASWRSDASKHHCPPATCASLRAAHPAQPGLDCPMLRKLLCGPSDEAKPTLCSRTQR
jgi:hypothetical protein